MLCVCGISSLDALEVKVLAMHVKVGCRFGRGVTRRSSTFFSFFVVVWYMKVKVEVLEGCVLAPLYHCFQLLEASGACQVVQAQCCCRARVRCYQLHMLPGWLPSMLWEVAGLLQPCIEQLLPSPIHGHACMPASCSPLARGL